MATSPPTPAPLREPPTHEDRYTRMAFSWWMFALVLTIIPYNMAAPAFKPDPPPPGQFVDVLQMARGLATIFLVVSLVLYVRFRHRLPEVTKPQWYGPADDKLRRMGFFAIWITMALYCWVFLGAIGDRGLQAVRANGTAAYLMPTVGGFVIEVLPSVEKEGVIHLTLVNSADFPLPVDPGRVLGQLTIETPSGPILVGQSEAVFKVELTPDQLALKPLPRLLEPKTQYTFMIPYPRWGQVIETAPANARVRVEYTPTGVIHVRQPLTLFEGPLGDLYPAANEN